MGMANYDIAMLRGFVEFDARKAEINCGGQQEYFNRLSEIEEDADRYLKEYNPIVVIYGQEMREEFLAEMKKIKQLLKQLEMTLALSEISELESAIDSASDKALSDGLIKFAAKMKIITQRLASAHITDDTNEKQLILVVDDTPDILSAVVRILGDKYRVIPMSSSKAALQTIEVYTPDLLILDIEMPVLNGVELARVIRVNQKFAKTPILFLTGFASHEIVLEAMSVGFIDYILKPIDKNNLLEKAALYLERGSAAR